jgi:hypothetical protein
LTKTAPFGAYINLSAFKSSSKRSIEHIAYGSAPRLIHFCVRFAFGEIDGSNIFS